MFIIFIKALILYLILLFIYFVPSSASPLSGASTAAAAQTQLPKLAPIGGPVNQVGDCGSVARNQSHAAEVLLISGLINPIEDVSSRVLLSIDDITKAVPNGCVPTLSSADCDRSLCYHLSYRSFDGTCNNLRNPLNGASFRAYRR
uniref:Uncharacterized protein n=1 Tax=Panagrolaimus sp. PS1159 TaxID=55785 RepID=A0AC35F4I1_9BILA